MPHFFAADLVGLSLALTLGIPVIVFPGFALGWWLDLLHFRSQPIPSRWSLATVFGIGLVPILLYLPFRLFSLHAMWLVLSFLSVAGIFATAQSASWPRLKDVSRSGKIVSVAWVLLCAVALLDVCVGSRLYPSTAVIDHSYRAQVIATLARAVHLPADSMSFYPGHPVQYRYHYFLFLFGAIIDQLGHGLVSSRIALISITIWTGLAFLACVAAFIRFFEPVENKPRATKIAWFLLAVGGLDILPVAAEVITRWLTGSHDVIFLSDIEWWNGFAQVFSWFDSVVWQPHHISGLLACLVGGLLLWDARQETGRRQLFAVLAAAFAFASATGMSILVTFVFALYLFLVALNLFLNTWRHALPVLAAGSLASVLLIPFFSELRAPNVSPGAADFDFVMRPFQPVIAIFQYSGITSSIAWNSAFFAALPLNYLIELGVFFLAGLWWWWDRRRTGALDSPREHLMKGLLLLSIFLATFVSWGTLYANDFGYRGLLPAQFILLLWATELGDRFWSSHLPDRPEERWLLRVAIAAVTLGIVTNVAGLALMRSRVALAAIGDPRRDPWIPGADFAERFGDARSAFCWIRKQTPSESIVQQSPQQWVLIAKELYSERTSATEGDFQDPRSGGTTSEFRATIAFAHQLFERGAHFSELVSTCSRTGINYVITQDSDPVWSDPQSYVWTTSPVFASPHVKVFSCKLR